VPDLGEVRIMEQELRTALTGSFIDQAEQHGFLRRLRALRLGVGWRRIRTRTRDEPPQEGVA
jgi:hypothetical protein